LAKQGGPQMATPSRDEGWISVAEAAELLGRSPQMVRNYVKNARLASRRTNRRGDMLVELLAVQTLGSKLNPLRGGVRRALSGTGGDFRFANLRLLEINEGYERALAAEMEASELDRAAAAKRSVSAQEVRKANARFRETVAQFHIPNDVADV
jgi:hypothetical protein